MISQLFLFSPRKLASCFLGYWVMLTSLKLVPRYKESGNYRDEKVRSNGLNQFWFKYRNGNKNARSFPFFRIDIEYPLHDLDPGLNMTQT